MQPEGEGLGEPYQPFVIIEAVYMGWFTLEFFVRFDIWYWIIWYLTFEIASFDIWFIVFIVYCQVPLQPKQGEGEEFFKWSKNLFQIDFVRKLMNIVDLLAILPYYISLVFYR